MKLFSFASSQLFVFAMHSQQDLVPPLDADLSLQTRFSFRIGKGSDTFQSTPLSRASKMSPDCIEPDYKYKGRRRYSLPRRSISLLL